MQKVSDRKGVIRAAAMDQRGSLRKDIAKHKGVDPNEITAAMMSEFKVAVSKALTPHASAILLDPEFGLDAVRARHKQAGVLLAYETTGYDQSTPGRVPLLIPTMTVQKLMADGADCIKILLYYTPYEKAEVNDLKHAWVERIGCECAYRDIPFFLEFVGYDEQGKGEDNVDFAKRKPDIVMKSMQEFSKPRYGVDVLKVEVPVNMKFVEGTGAYKGDKAYSRDEAKKWFQQAAQAAGKPFIYLSAGVTDEVFRETIELAHDAGTNFSGVLCGRATWLAGVSIYAKEGLAAFDKWVNDRGVRNIQMLNEVLDKSAHPWYEKYGGKDQVQVVDLAGNPAKVAVG
ncbi:MAG TPA: tagatose 1,6-diphosphate aldolase [Candidatus Xenobia bacterium]|jgi:tagatose 1,6-diphosphate aldolase